MMATKKGATMANCYDKALTNFKDLTKKYEPLLQTYFLFKMNALSHDFMDRQRAK